MQNQFLTASVVLGLLIGCQKSSSPTNLQDVKLRQKSGASSILYSEGEIVLLRNCNIEVEVVTRNCPTPANIPAKAMPVRVYIARLAKAFGVDEDIVRLGSVEKFNRLLEETKQAINSGSLKPDELEKAKSYMQRLEANAERSMTSINIVAKLAAGQELTLNESFNNDFALVISPFSGGLSGAANIQLIRDSNTGLIWSSLGEVCWYDASDIARVGGMCRTRDQEPHASVPDGCARRFGLAWGLPTAAQIKTTLQGPIGPLPGWDRNGTYHRYRRAYNSEGWMEGFENFYRSYDARFQDAVTYCVAKASEIEPQGDVDGDGIANSVDKCNRLPTSRTAPVDFTGPRIGCAAGQTTDAQLGDTLVGDGTTRSASSIETYNPGNASRYIDKTSSPVACTTQNGLPGTKVYTGKWDPEIVSQDGTKGVWIAPPYSNWTECR